MINDVACCLQAMGMALNRKNTANLISLIQGPPGTGKTAVITGILAGLLHNNAFSGPATAGGNNRPKSAAAQSAASNTAASAAATGPAAGQGLRADRVPAHRVLVCAQSNAAIDELITRLNSRGLATGSTDGATSRPLAMLRLGNIDATHPAALQFHIDYVVDSLTGSGDAAGAGASRAAQGVAAELRRLRSELASVADSIAAATISGAATSPTCVSGTCCMNCQFCARAGCSA